MVPLFGILILNLVGNKGWFYDKLILIPKPFQRQGGPSYSHRTMSKTQIYPTRWRRLDLQQKQEGQTKKFSLALVLLMMLLVASAISSVSLGYSTDAIAFASSSCGQLMIVSLTSHTHTTYTSSPRQVQRHYFLFPPSAFGSRRQRQKYGEHEICWYLILGGLLQYTGMVPPGVTLDVRWSLLHFQLEVLFLGSSCKMVAGQHDSPT
jgi:hypothetical protein